MKSSLRIGCASAFWGDTQSAPRQLVEQGKLDVLVMDYLSEVTLSLLAGAKRKNPEAGFIPDVVSALSPLLASIQTQGIKVIANAGGLNAQACAKAIHQLVKQQDLTLKIAVVEGDDLLPEAEALQGQGITDMFSGEPLPTRCLSMNAYLGVQPIVAALEEGADIIITGRVADSALVLAPLVHAFEWALDDWGRLAQGSLAGHLLECGAQVTGGNFTDWQSVSQFENMGFPIAVCEPSGEFVITKPDNTGGLVNALTVSEQLLYEIGDPSYYLLPDVVCDFRSVRLDDLGGDQVRVQGAKGLPATSTYKVCATYLNGYRCIASFLLYGQDAQAKGQCVAEAILTKTSAMISDTLGLGPFTETQIDLLGAGHLSAQSTVSAPEVVVRIAVRHPDKSALELFRREIAQAATGMVPGITGLVGGRPSVSPCIELFSFLIEKERVQSSVQMMGEAEVRIILPQQANGYFEQNQPLFSEEDDVPPVSEVCDVSVPLSTLAVARSGDKGNHANIGVIARQSDYLPYINQSLSESVVAECFAQQLDPVEGRVTRFFLPTLNAYNFLLENSLGGGGMASLRADPQGKAFAQHLLTLPISIPSSLAKELA